MASLFKRINPKNGKLFKYWWVKYSINGKEFRESTRCEKKFDAEQILKAKYIPQEINSFNKINLFIVKKELKKCLVEYRDQVLIHSDDGIKRKSSGTINRQQTNINNFISYVDLQKITKFDNITEDVIRDYIQNHLIKFKKKKENTVYKDVQILKTFFQWAKKKYYCSEDPTENIRNPKPPPTVPRFFSHEEVKKIFNNAKEPYLSMFKLLYLTGLRIQELLNVEWTDVISERKLIIIRVKDGNKPKRETFVHLNESALSVIKEMEKTKGVNKYLFTNQIGNQHKQGKVSSYAVRLYTKLGISPEDPNHSWRHTCASHLVIAGVSLYIVKEILRHKSIKETEIYAHLSRESVQKALELLVL